MGFQIFALPGLPSDVASAALLISPIRKTIDEKASSAPSLWPYLVGMGAKRQGEFLAGRLCAAQCLRTMGVNAPFPLSVHNRLPVWPHGVAGSISHCNSLATAITAPKSKYRALGIDVELLIAPNTEWEIRNCVGCVEEWTELEKHIPCQRQSLTRLFSAKEALYKALFPSVGHFKNFDAARLCGIETETLLFQLSHDWAPDWPADTLVNVRQCWIGQVLVSVVCMEQKHS